MSGDRRGGRSLRVVDSATRDGTAKESTSTEAEDGEVVSLIAPNLAPPVRATVAAGLVPDDSTEYPRGEKEID